MKKRFMKKKQQTLYDYGYDERDLAIYHFRYCLSRSSYAVSTGIEFLVRNWDKFSLSDKKLYQREIEEHFELYGKEKYRLEWNSWSVILALPLEEIK